MNVADPVDDGDAINRGYFMYYMQIAKVPVDGLRNYVEALEEELKAVKATLHKLIEDAYKKAAIAERIIRTIKNYLYRQFSLRGKYVWIDAIESITSEYNNRKNRTTGMKPIEVKADTQLKAYRHIKLFNKKHRFNVGDVVRISKHKSVFAKGYTPNWSSELFKIAKVQITNPVTYLLEDMKGKPILGGFYEQELQKAKYSDIYLVEKVLRRKKDKVYVKWWGLDEKSWIENDNIVL
ncbi:uncharacterized protein LOC116182882 [Photinus pyralis]|uniref:uncharacterized protein LOC116165790 n=1 Tax=Photinus pyralis TaxID=7054 RepID=UPI0012670914|nr:uncharacterized protein LOC116165790 [Photinus pyralis]XP_031359305.1 uncharacterized protein LOC116182882 [Photinus pyralis]